MKIAIHSEAAPKAVGPYSQAIQTGKMVFVSGQLGMNSDGAMVGEDVASQARQCLENLRVILKEVGMTMDQVVKATIFLTDLNDFGTVNAIYQEAFTPPYPARACIEVSRLPRDGKVEIEVIAALD